jgi:hypothetical protein
MIYSFSKNDINVAKLDTELKVLNPAITAISVTGDEVIVHVSRDLIESEVTAVSVAISSHSSADIVSPQEVVRNVIINAMSFGNSLIVEFATENVLMGITQAGKTKAVSDLLSDVMRYAMSGSLYEVINEVDRLLQAGLPAELEPFISTSRLTSFRQKIVTYLQG